jgi:hypothetical protein
VPAALYSPRRFLVLISVQLKMANLPETCSVSYNTEKKIELYPGFYVDGKNETRSQICTVQQDAAIE